MTQVEDFLDGYEAPVEEVAICGRPALIADHARLEAEIAGHHGGLGGVPRELLDRLESIEAEIEASVKVFRFRAVPFKAWADLLAAHPPSKQERSEGHAAHPETFEPAAVAAASFDPELSVEQAGRMRDVLPPSEWVQLVWTVQRLHQERAGSPKSLLLSARRHMSDGSSGTPPSMESPEGGSLAGSGEQ